jgi:putative iron-dependent peroxidase
MMCSRSADVAMSHGADSSHQHQHKQEVPSENKDTSTGGFVGFKPFNAGPPPIQPTSSTLDAMDTPQRSVLQPNKPFVGFILLRLKPGYDVQAIKQAISFLPVFWPDDSPNHGQKQVPGLLQWANDISNEHGIDALYITVGFSFELWKHWYPENFPKNFIPYAEKKSHLPNVKTVFPSTGGDILLHIKANEEKMIHETVKKCKELFAGHATFEENYAKNSKDFRNPFGYIDGGLNPNTSGNPTQDIGPMFNAQVDMGRIATTIIGNEDPANLHGSYAFTADWVLDMKFTKQPEKCQNHVFGRDKKSGEFLLSPPKMPAELPNAHTTRAFLPVNQEEGAFFLPLNIFRQPGSWAKGNNKGLFFLAYARSSLVFEMMLQSMLGNSPQAQYDHLLDWANPQSGQYWFIPSMQQLVNIAKQNYNPNKQ